MNSLMELKKDPTNLQIEEQLMTITENFRTDFSKETQDEILDYVKNHLLDVFAYNCFRDELKYFFESEKSDKTFKTLDGEEVSIYDKFNHFDFEGLINMDLRFSDEEVKS